MTDNKFIETLASVQLFVRVKRVEDAWGNWYDALETERLYTLKDMEEYLKEDPHATFTQLWV